MKTKMLDVLISLDVDNNMISLTAYMYMNLRTSDHFQHFGHLDLSDADCTKNTADAYRCGKAIAV
jgi:hypothetical protein